MALHSKKDFAEMCDLTTGNLSVYEGRRKVVYSGDYVDDSIEPNKSFLEKRKAKAQKESPSENPFADLPTVTKKEVKVKERDHPAPKVKPADSSKGKLYQLDHEKVQLQNEKLSLNNEMLRRKLEKIEGESIPTTLVKAIISQLGRSFPTEYKNLYEQSLVEISKKYNISLEDQAKYKGSAIENINKATGRAISQSRRELNNVIKLFSEKKEVGEREQ